jgi:hypothetical protein
VSKLFSASSASKLLTVIVFWFSLNGGLAAADFTFAAFGDTPYSAEEEERFPALVAEMNREPLAFAVHIGDFKAAWQPCSDELYRQRREWFDLFHHPFVFIPGDNEWTDCRQRRAGGYDPVERLGKLRELFARGGETLGQRMLPLERQSPAYPEHARWRHGGLVFAALNLPGGANNARRDPAESRARTAAAIEWMAQTFRAARKAGAPAAVIFIHANPWAQPSAHFFGYREFLEALDAQTREFPGEVLLVHGDTHRYRVDRPAIHHDGRTPPANFTRVEVFGYPTMNWVRVRVSEEAGRIRFAVTPGS